jgi:hypothetical protein
MRDAVPVIGEGATDEDRARSSVDFDWVTRDVRDLVLDEDLQNKRSHFVLKSIAQSLTAALLRMF